MATASAVIVNRRKEERSQTTRGGSAAENTLTEILSEADEAERGATFVPSSLETGEVSARVCSNAAAMEKFLATHAVETEGGQMYFLAKDKITGKLVEQMRAVVDKRKGFMQLGFFLTVLLYFSMLYYEMPHSATTSNISSCAAKYSGPNCTTACSSAIL